MRSINQSASVAFCIAVSLVTVFGAASVHAQEFPSRPVRLMMPFGGGIEADTRARVLVRALHERHGWTIVPENRPGSTMLAMQVVAQAPADGHTLLFSTTSMMMQRFSAAAPFDIQKEFTPLTRIISFPTIMTVHPALPVKNLAELLAYAKANPGKLTYATSIGTTNVNFLAAEHLKQTIGLEMTQIPYKLSSQMYVDNMAGVVPVMITAPTEVSAFLKAGKLRGIAIFARTRSELAPEVPTPEEAGLPRLEVDSWHGLMVHAKTPPELVARIHRTLQSTLRLPELREQFMKLSGAAPVTNDTPESYAQLIANSTRLWGEVIRKSNIKVD